MAEKWQGTAKSPKIQGVTPAQAWAIVGDYYGLHKVYTSAFHSSSKGTHKCDGNPGSFRHTVFTIPARGEHPPQCHWVKDRLLSIDDQGMSYTFEFVEDSMGFGRFVSTLRVVPAGQDGCVIEWTYDCNPATVDGWTKADQATFMQNGVEEMAKMVQETIAAA